MAKSGATTRVNINYAAIGSKLKASTKRAQMVLDTQVLKDCGPYTPHDQGDLESSGQRASKIGSGEVSWATPYARRQYYSLPNKSHDKRPMAVMRWFEAAKAARKAAWLRVAKAAGGKWR